MTDVSLSTAPTAPGGLPLLGHLLPLLRDRLGYLQSLPAHGEVVQIRVGTHPVWVVTSPRIVREILAVQPDSFTKGTLFDKLKVFGGVPLPIAEGKAHLQRRRVMQPAFHRERINSYIQTMIDTTERALADKTWTDGARVDVLPEMQLMAQGVVMSCLFGSDPARGEALTIMHAVDTVFATAIKRATAPVTEHLPFGRRKLRRANETIRRAVADILADRRRNPADRDDLVTLLLDARDEDGRPLPDEEILSEITALLASGSETTAVTMSWLFHQLGRHPELEARLEAEVDAATAGGPLTPSHLSQLPFTRRLVQETLRMHTPAWIITRRASVEVQLGDTRLPAGADIIWSPWCLHRDPQSYPDPLVFDPDRWLPERPQPAREAFFPFGAGKRMCIADVFSMAEAQVIIALVASRWRLRPAPGTTVRPVPAITPQPSGLSMILEARRPAARAAAA